MYKKEAEDQKGVVDKLINEKGEEWYIKNAVRIIFFGRCGGILVLSTKLPIIHHDHWCPFIINRERC